MHYTPVVPVAPTGRSASRSFGILTSFPPTACGIATFSAALAAGLISNGSTVDVVRSGPTPDLEDALVLASLGAGGPEPAARAADVLNGTDVAIVQHEYGLYDGPDGESVVEVLARLTVPTIVVAHTVLQSPSTNQRVVLERVCAAADSVVVMTQSARLRLLEAFAVDADKVVVIPHGATTPPGPVSSAGSGRASAGRAADRLAGAAPRLLTWGLLGPGKGIEWAIDAVATLGDLRPRPTYVIAGATHPKVLARSGQSYRRMLVRRGLDAGTEAYLTFDDTYRDLPALMNLIRSATLVVLPYDSQDQVTSGVLVDAVAAGRPVVSTAFPHAVELLGSGAGLVVPQRDSAALADAIRAVLTDPALAAGMAAEARRLAPELSWGAVAGHYGALAGRLVAARATVSS